MTRPSSRRLSIVAAALLALAGAGPAPATRNAKTCIALAGDSTVTDDAGWGKGFALSLNDKDVQCVNFAKGGRASGSFRREGRWDDVLALKPDVVLIQFGHNDQAGHGADRETDPGTTYKANIEKYVDDARAAGIKPVLVTPISRRQWDRDGHIKSTLQPYADAVLAVAKEKDVPVIDLHRWAVEYYESLGKEGCELISPTKEGGAFDGTHLNATGGQLFGTFMSVELRRAVPEVSRAIRGYIVQEKRLPATRRAGAEYPAMPKAGPAVARGAKAITVAADGTGDFKTIRDAVAAVAENNADRTTIHIRPGIYREQVIVPPNKPNVTLEGESAETTVMSYALNVYDPILAGVPQYCTGNGLCVFAEGFRAANMTFQNSSGDHGQAMAVKNEGDRSVFSRCRLTGWQDTLMASKGRQYYADCYIEGRVDFIYGGATAVFDRCEIHSKNGGYVTAASTDEKNPFGYVFLDCKLTGDGAPAQLGRPWRPFAAVSFIRCDIGPHIRADGWNNWGKADNEKTARYSEYKNTGPGADVSQRVPWSRQLTDAEAQTYTVAHILAGKDGWQP